MELVLGPELDGVIHGRLPMAGENDKTEMLERKGRDALRLMENALELLDECDPAGDVSPHLDLAIHRLKARLSPEPFD
jgi:hypothetical protein